MGSYIQEGGDRFTTAWAAASKGDSKSADWRQATQVKHLCRSAVKLRLWSSMANSERRPFWMLWALSRACWNFRQIAWSLAAGTLGSIRAFC